MDSRALEPHRRRVVGRRECWMSRVLVDAPPLATERLRVLKRLWGWNDSGRKTPGGPWGSMNGAGRGVASRRLLRERASGRPSITTPRCRRVDTRPRSRGCQSSSPPREGRGRPPQRSRTRRLLLRRANRESRSGECRLPASGVPDFRFGGRDQGPSRSGPAAESRHKTSSARSSARSSPVSPARAAHPRPAALPPAASPSTRAKR